MATTATLTGTFTLPNDAAPDSAVLSVILSAMDTDQNTRHVLPDDGSFTVALVAGAIPAGQEIWKNTAGLRGTHYRATLAWAASDGRLLSRYLGSFQVGDDASYDMADLLDQPPIATLPEGWYSTLTQGDYDAAITARDEAVAARDQIFAEGGQVTLTGTQTLTNKTLASPALTGTPTAPTAAQGTNTTQVATTEFVVSELDTALTDTFAPMLGGDLIFNVPAQYPTIQAAVDAALRYVTSGYRLEVKIASGHALTHGIRLVGAQASGIKITSVDAVVHIAPGFVPVDSNEWPASSLALAAFVDTDTPLWNILVDLTGTSGVDGMMVFGRSRAQVGPTWGVNNGRCNLEVRGGAEIVAPGSNWNGASNENIRITSGARAELRDSTAHDGWQFGADGISYMYGSVLVSRGSVANLQGIKIYRPRASAISVRRSFISMKYADIQELSYGGFITTGNAIHIHDGSIISAATVTVDGVPMTRLHTSTGLIGCMTEDGVIFDGVSTGLDSGLALNDGSQKAGYSKVLWGGGWDADPATFPGDGGSRYWPSLNLQRQNDDNSAEVRLYFQRFDGRNLSFVRTWDSDNVMTTARYLLDNDLTATATDSTAGLVLKTGDAGVLGRIDTPNIDLDAEYFGFWGNAGTSAPPVVRPDGLTGDSRWAGLTLGNYNSRLQLARRTDASSRLYVRSRDHAAWSDWSEILTDTDLTATATDSTAGLVLKTGDAGVLGRIDTPNIDLDAEYFGFWGNAGTSAPPVVRPDGLTGDSRWAGLTLGNYNSRLQLARRTDASSRLYVRSRDHAAWSDWSEILTAARILSSIASTPAFVGQQAFVNGVEYRAFGIASTADWVPVASANRSGTTANRPTTQLFVGRQYFDTDLNKPIWRNAANSGWVDAVGATV